MIDMLTTSQSIMGLNQKVYFVLKNAMVQTMPTK